jgi:hypothetical protein
MRIQESGEHSNNKDRTMCTTKEKVEISYQQQYVKLLEFHLRFGSSTRSLHRNHYFRDTIFIHFSAFDAKGQKLNYSLICIQFENSNPSFQ